ncbi:MAG: hypothetical protein FWJ70_06940 [Micromonosporaceae bacterium]|jgi:hypothetical protein
MTVASSGSDLRDPQEMGRLVDRVAEAVVGCPGVAGLWRGPAGTYLPHRTVPGIAVRDGVVSVSVVARYGPDLSAVAAQVRDAVRRVVPDSRVDVQIEDIEPPAGRKGMSRHG